MVSVQTVVPLKYSLEFKRDIKKGNYGQCAEFTTKLLEQGDGKMKDICPVTSAEHELCWNKESINFASDSITFITIELSSFDEEEKLSKVQAAGDTIILPASMQKKIKLQNFQILLY